MATSPKDTVYNPTDDEIKNALEKRNWGKTYLTDFLNKADKNTRITYLNLEGYFEMLESLSDIFKAASDNLKPSDDPNRIINLLLGRAQGNYFAAIRLSSSGQLPETYLQLRACIESALYAFNIYSYPNFAQVWLDRHKDKQSRKECKKHFQLKAIQNDLIKNNKSLGENIEKDYELCIDYGAHPNERSISANLNFNDKNVALEFLNTKEGIFEWCLLACVMCGIDALKIFNLIYPDDFKKFNAEIKMEAIHKQGNRIIPAVRYKLGIITH